MHKMSRPFAFRTMFAATALGVSALSGAAHAAEATVIELTQVGCQFLESENDLDDLELGNKMVLLMDILKETEMLGDDLCECRFMALPVAVRAR